MAGDRLETIPDERLYELCNEYDVEVEECHSRAEMIETLREAIRETLVDHEASNNDTMRVGERKYDISAGELVLVERNGPDYGEAELPERYNETRMVLLLRDPAWAYAYWDVRDKQMEEVANEPGFSGLSLRLIEMDNLDMQDHTVVDSVDIPVQPEDNRWYINLPQLDTNYYTELVAHYEENWSVLARSNPVSVPSGGIAQDVSVSDQSYTSEETIVALSGVERLGVSSFGQRIPQRIISLIDEFVGE